MVRGSFPTPHSIISYPTTTTRYALLDGATENVTVTVFGTTVAASPTYVAASAATGSKNINFLTP